VNNASLALSLTKQKRTEANDDYEKKRQDKFRGGKRWAQ
jgi:hypothetical protein